MAGGSRQTCSEEWVLEQLLEFRTPLMNYITSAIPNRLDAEDVFQEVCMKIWRKQSEFEPGSNFRSWIFTIARFTILDNRKRYATRRVVYLDADTLELLAEDLKGDRHAAREDERYPDALAHCLGDLDERLPRLLKRHYVEGFSLRDLAEKEQMSVSALKQLLYRTRNRLRGCIRERLKPAST